jgi:putative acyl-CoA dehydrogenase
MSPFVQPGPQLSANQFLSDELLQALLQTRLPKDVYGLILPDLIKFGARVSSELMNYAADAETNPPRVINSSTIEVSQGWRRLHEISAEEGLIAIAFERKLGQYSRLHQFAKLYLFHPSSAFYSCPLAMVDGAARILQIHGTPELKATAFKNLTTRSPKDFWSSGQWMTERIGGSDVSQTETIAKQDASGWRLYGEKFFTSATTSQMTLTLARPEGSPGGSAGLALFFARVVDDNGQLANIEIIKLKDKLGTRALPTAELRLNGTTAIILSAPGEGVKKISTLLNITRLHNSVCATAQLRRGLSLAKDYAKKRKVFGKLLSEQPLHVETLANVELDCAAGTVLVFHLAALLGKEECGEASAEELQLLRLLTPVVKLWTAKKSLSGTSEIVEAFGGDGYVEETGIPKLLRDAQVFSIWEGTTNVLSLDVLRVIAKPEARSAFFTDIEKRLRSLNPSLRELAERVEQTVKQLRTYLGSIANADRLDVEAGARDLAFGLAQAYIGSLLLEFTESCAKQSTYPRSRILAERFTAKSWSANQASGNSRAASSDLLF